MSLMKEEIDYSIDNVKADTYCYECDSQFCDHSALLDHRRLLHNSSTKNPWNIQSLYDLQYFNCPSCSYKNNLKQEFIDHAFHFHPESCWYLNNISDGSMSDVEIPDETKGPLDFKSGLENRFSNGGLDIKVEEFDDNDQEYDPNDQEYDYDNEEFDYNNPELVDTGDDPDFICKQCEKVCVSKKDLSFHYSSEHQDLNMFHCNICTKSFGTSKKLIVHIKNHKYSNGQKKCEFCGKSFCNSYYLKNHIRVVHEGHKDFNCESCGKSFTAETSLKKHIRIIHEGRKDYKCDICGKAVGTLSSLKNHKIKIHEGPKEFICESCSKKFGRSNALTAHMIKVHDRRTDNICDSCGKNFNSETSLKQHVAKIHNSEKVKKILECPHCPDKTFENKTDLGRHIRRKHVVKEKNCVCTICGKAYTDMAFLKEHMYR